MKLPTLFLGASFVASVFAHPLDLPFSLSNDDIQTLDRRQSNVVPVTGTSGAVKPRLEIRQMKAAFPNQFSLLILALREFQNKPESEATSYYQIAGIHGVPNVDYNGVNQCSTCSGADGYCTHDSVLFPAWHRAYVTLFEQEFIKVAKDIANSWPTSGSSKTRRQMQNAANNLRWPYWDWAAEPAGGNTLPPVVTRLRITIDGPKGRQTVQNPLFRYDFEDPSNLKYAPFTKWHKTLRYPTSNAASATSDTPASRKAMNSVRASLQDQVYQLFSTCKDYLHFSNDQAGSSSTGCSNSLEGIHNTIHTVTGGIPSQTVASSGHMYYLALAGFDPVFWLHHANVDRLFAMWQTINPNAYGASQVAPHHTWTIAKGSRQNANSPLAPFYKDNGNNFWTTREVRDWTIFGYTYPEFAHSDGSKRAIQQYVNKLYGPNASATAGSSKRDAAPEPGLGDIIPSFSAPNGSTYQYVANIQTPRYALGGSYYIFMFMGQPECEDPQTWINDENLIGPMGILAQDEMKGANVTVAGSIPITRKLQNKFDCGLLNELNQMIVTPFLENALQWRILGPDGTCVEPEDVPGFEVSVYASTSTQPCDDDSDLPQWSDFQPLISVTKDKAGGLNSLLDGASLLGEHPPFMEGSEHGGW